MAQSTTLPVCMQLVAEWTALVPRGSTKKLGHGTQICIKHQLKATVNELHWFKNRCFKCVFIFGARVLPGNSVPVRGVHYGCSGCLPVHSLGNSSTRRCIAIGTVHPKCLHDSWPQPVLNLKNRYVLYSVSLDCMSTVGQYDGYERL